MIDAQPKYGHIYGNENLTVAQLQFLEGLGLDDLHDLKESLAAQSYELELRLEDTVDPVARDALIGQKIEIGHMQAAVNALIVEKNLPEQAVA